MTAIVADPTEPLSRCTGHCCRSFPLVVSGAVIGPEELEGLRSRVQDGSKIVDMVVPFLGPLQEGAGQRWTCRHFDGASCGAYESRPELCKLHGSAGRPCGEEECTLRLPVLVPARSLLRLVRHGARAC